MNQFHYYHIISYVEDYHDIITFLLLNHKCHKIILTLPFYQYKQIHPRMIFPGLINVIFDIPVSSLFLQELVSKANKLFGLTSIINKVNIQTFQSTNKTMQTFNSKLFNQLKKYKLHLKIQSNINSFLSNNSLQIVSLGFDYNESVEMKTINPNIKELDITLNSFTPIHPLNIFLQKFLLKKLIIRIDYQCQWNYIRSLAKLISSTNANGIIYISNKVIYESGEIDDLLIDIPRNVCIIFSDGYIGCNGFSCRFGKFEEDGIIQRDGESSVIVPIPSPEILIDHTSYATQLKTIDLSQKNWILSVETAYNLKNIILPTSIVSLKLYNPPSFLPMNLTQLHMENVNNSMVNLSCAAFSQLILRKCNIESLQVPSTLTYFSSTYNTFLKVGLNCLMKKASFQSCQLPMLLIPTTCSYLNVYCSKIAFVQLTGLRHLEIYHSDFSKLATTTTRLTQLTGLTFISKTAPEFTSLTEIPILKFSNSLQQCKLQYVCFSKLLAPHLTQLTVDFVQPVLISGSGGIVLPTSETPPNELPPLPEKSSTVISPSFSMPCLSDCYLTGIPSLTSPIDSWRLFIEGCNDLVLGSVNALHLKNCRGKVRFNSEKSASKICSLSLYNCYLDNESFQQFKAIEHLRIDVFGNFKSSEWRYQTFSQLKDIIITAKGINLGAIILPTSVTSLSLSSPKQKGKLTKKVIHQLKVLSIN